MVGRGNCLERQGPCGVRDYAAHERRIIGNADHSSSTSRVSKMRKRGSDRRGDSAPIGVARPEEAAETSETPPRRAVGHAGNLMAPLLDPVARWSSYSGGADPLRICGRKRGSPALHEI